MFSYDQIKLCYENTKRDTVATSPRDGEAKKAICAYAAQIAGMISLEAIRPRKTSLAAQQQFAKATNNASLGDDAGTE